MTPIEYVVLVNSACAVAWSDDGTREAMYVVVPTSMKANEKPLSAVTAMNVTGSAATAHSADRSTSTEIPPTISHSTRNPTRDPREQDHQRDLDGRVHRPADADQGRVAAQVDDPQREQRQRGGARDPGERRGHEEQPEPRQAQQPEAGQRADAGHPQAPLRPPEQQRRRHARGRHRDRVDDERRRQADRRDRRPDGDGRDHEPDRPEGPRLAEPRPVGPQALDGARVHERREPRRAERQQGDDQDQPWHLDPGRQHEPEHGRPQRAGEVGRPDVTQPVGDKTPGGRREDRDGRRHRREQPDRRQADAQRLEVQRRVRDPDRDRR